MTAEQFIDHVRALPREKRLELYRSLPPGVLASIVMPEKVIEMLKAGDPSWAMPTLSE